MKTLNAPTKWPNLVMTISGGISALLGLVVLLGWHTQNQFLIQIISTSAPMQYNTALGFLFCGASVLATRFGRPSIGMIAGSFAGVIGTLTLTQYAAAINFGIDELLMDHHITHKTSHPGRMAPNTAIAFLCCAAALTFINRLPLTRHRSIVLALLGSLVAALGTVALFGYLGNVEAAYGWGELTRMAVHTAFGFAVLGQGIIAFGWRETAIRERRAPGWLPIVVVICVATITASLWQALAAKEHAQITRIIQLGTSNIKNEIETATRTQMFALDRMAEEWGARGGIPKDEWDLDVERYTRHHPGVEAIAWIDPSFRVRRLAPKDGSASAEELYIDPDRRQWKALERAKNKKHGTITQSVELVDGGKGFVAYLPIFYGEEFGGFISGAYRIQDFFDSALDKETLELYSLAALEGEEEIYAHATERKHEARWGQMATVALRDATWTIKVWPRPELLKESQSPLALLVLLGGLAMACLLGLTASLAQMTKRRAKKLHGINEELHLEVLERRQAQRELRLANENLKQNTERIEKQAMEIASVNTTLKELVSLDPLTSLLNRRGLEQALKVIVGGLQRSGGAAHAFLMDLDNFKKVNQAFGYVMGDSVLKRVARRLKGALRAADSVARVGGDEFMVILPETGQAEALKVAQKVRLEISKIVIGMAQGETFHLTASVGMVPLTRTPVSVEELVENSYWVLSQSKQKGKNTVLYKGDAGTREDKSPDILAGVLGATPDNNNFFAAQQPIIELKDHAEVAYELLTRLAARETIMPKDFFRSAMEANLLTFIDRMCLRACLLASHRFPAGTRLHVNLFPSTMMEIPIEQLLEEFHVANKQISYCIEISEQQIMGDPSHLISAVKALKEMDISVAIDDVGFGSSCVESLVLLEPNIVKIDSSCISGIARNEGKARSLKRLLRVVESCDAEAIAEGIETEADLKILLDLGVRYGQGFYFAQPTKVSAAA